MCRMVAIRPAAADETRAVLGGFRRQAREGATGSDAVRRHPDGWGVVVGEGGRVERWARSVRDAFSDPAYEDVVARAVSTPPTVLLAHLRNASVGAKRPENTHPFVARGWAFAHNGTIHDSERIAAPRAKHEGDTDSERYFRRFLHEWTRERDPLAALRETVEAIDAQCSYSSITCLFTDGSTLYGYRRVGDDPMECGTKACQRQHYTLGVGRHGRSLVVAQEPTHLHVTDWREVPDGNILEWREDAAPVVRRLAAALPAR